MERYAPPSVALLISALAITIGTSYTHSLQGSSTEEKNPAPAQSGLDHPRPTDIETVWSAWLAKKLDGAAEEPIRDSKGAGRCDIFVSYPRILAVEVEWAKASKAVESLDQARRYARALGGDGVIIFLVGRGDISVEKAIVSTVREFAGDCSPPVAVLSLDVRDPDWKALGEKLFPK